MTATRLLIVVSGITLTSYISWSCGHGKLAYNAGRDGEKSTI